MGRFAEDVARFAAESKSRILALFQHSVQDVVEEMQALVPVETGFLKSSLAASTAGPISTPTKKPQEGISYAYNGEEVSAVIAGAKIGDTIYVAYTADYARFAEFGSRGRPGRAMVRLACQRWPNIVQDRIARLRSGTATARGR